MDLFAHQQGEGGTPVVFLHGFAGSHAVWATIQTAISLARQTLAYDLPGHGRSSDFPDAGPAKRAADAIIQDLQARGIERAHLVGHSMGGAIAALIAILDAPRVASLTLLAPGGFGPEINHRLLSRVAAAEAAETLLPCLEALHGWMSPVADEAVTTALAMRAAPGQVDILKTIARGLVRDGRQGQLPRDKLEALDMPVTVAWGEIDNVLPVRHARNLPAQFAVHIFPDLGHMLPEETPDAVIRIVERTIAAGDAV